VTRDGSTKRRESDRSKGWSVASSNLEEEESEQYCPTERTSDQVGVAVPVRLEEQIDGLLGQQHPGAGQVRRRIARAHVAEVNHGPEFPVRGDEVGRMEIPVNPHRWQRARGGGDRGVLHPSKARRVNQSAQTVESLLESVSARCQRHAASAIRRRVTRGALVQGSKEASERAGGVIGTLECRRVQRRTSEPSGYHPEIRVLVARPTDAKRDGRGDRQSRREFGQPSDLIGQECHADVPSRKAHQQVAAKTRKGVVETVGDVMLRPVAEVGKLFAHEGPDNALADVEVGLGPVHDAKLPVGDAEIRSDGWH
jgi:hypothetical protein